MKAQVPDILEKGRERTGIYGSDASFGWNGRFLIHHPETSKLILLVISDGLGWEHVSVSLPRERRCPIWDEMCFVKELCWDDEETVVQYHPAAKDYVNSHPYVLHLFRPIGQSMPTPSPLMVGLGRKRKR